jgi:hypothetical protein
VVRDAPPLRDRQFSGTDVHAAVELHGVGVHDLSADCGAEPLGHRECQRRLSGAGGADDRERSHSVNTPVASLLPTGTQAPTK